jgi:hypothetical protein
MVKKRWCLVHDAKFSGSVMLMAGKDGYIQKAWCRAG